MLSTPGERFSLTNAVDADVGENSIETYYLSDSDTFTIEIQSGSDGTKYVDLVLKASLDREKQAVHTLTLTAVDGGVPARLGTASIIIQVLDTNDNAPQFDRQVYSVDLIENAPIGTLIMQLNATDLDEGVNAEVIYSFTLYTSEKTQEKFSLDPSSGEIRVKDMTDFEEVKSFEMYVEAKDKAVNPLSGQCKILVFITDLNDNHPEITIKSFHSSIKENDPVGTVIAVISVSDRDSGDNGKVVLSIHNAEILPFALNKSSEDFFELIVTESLDRELKNSYDITLYVTDRGTPPLTDNETISLTVQDVNDNAPTFPQSFYTIHLMENNDPAGGQIATVSAQDYDYGENAQVTYSLLDSPSVPLSTAISINSVTGEIYSMQTFNYEQVKTLHFQVMATDSGVPPLSSNATVNVFILDENDNSPVILPSYSEPGSFNSENIPYSAEAGYFVAKIRAVDADSGYNALLSYHLTEPKGTNLFRIGSSTGEIRTKRRMSDNDLKTHPLLITVSDNGEPSLSATMSMDVVVVESLDDIKTSFREVPVKEESFSDLNLYLLIAIVSVSVIFLLSLVGLIAVKCYRTDSSFSRYSAPVISTHPDGSWSFSKSTQQYDVCFSSDTIKSDVVVFPSPFPPADAELISINTCSNTSSSFAFSFFS
uniref:Cadherin domain-containing protein n=1 Tax=Sinocyclocheilus anshuiensis TaxID=1608454 RepID=A0A671QIP4_9TELE